jgi:hypothetical protein
LPAAASLRGGARLPPARRRVDPRLAQQEPIELGMDAHPIAHCLQRNHLAAIDQP